MRPIFVFVGAALIATALVPSCQEPTKITLEFHTDVACERTRGVRIAAGRPGAVERSEPKMTTRRCEPGAPLATIGTVVVTPESSDDARVAFRAVIGVDVDVSECTAERGYEGCIVQRRELAYVPNLPLLVPIDFLEDCRNVPCDESTTCVAGGLCVSSLVERPERCASPTGCYPDGDRSHERNADAGEPRTDGGPSLDASPDAPADVAAPSDAASDGGLAFLCPNTSIPTQACAAGGTCCWREDANSAVCQEPCLYRPLKCTNRSSCGPNEYCCYDALAHTSSCSLNTCGIIDYFCVTDFDCADLPQPTCIKDTPETIFGVCAHH